MPDSTLSIHPSSPIFSAQHRKHALVDVLAPDIVVAGVPAPDAVTGCLLVGGGLMVLATLAPHTVVRHQRHHLEGVEADDVNAVLVLDGGGRVEAPGWAYQVRAGDILYMPAHCLTTMRTSEDCHLLILRLSFRRFSNGQGGKFSDFKARLALRDSPLRLAVFNYVQHVLPSLGDSALATVAHAEQAFIALLAAVYAEARHATTPPAHCLWDRLVLAVDTMLSDADLEVATLAAALGVTTRHVHRQFEQHGLRYGSYLLEQRLARAREDLRRPLLAELGVAQIGYGAGFNSASHFSRCFRQRYGMSPAAFRTLT